MSENSCAEQPISKILAIKNEGNKAYTEGCKRSQDESGKRLLKQACILYGQAIEAILEMESCSVESENSGVVSNNELDIIRPTLFLNLAAANLKLGGAEECLRCCNSAIQLCNSPGLLYSDMKSAEEVALVMHPAAQAMQSLIAKALFRRGKCFEALGDCTRALVDYQDAQAISPTDKEIQNSVTSIRTKAHRAPNPVRNVTDTAHPVTMSLPGSLIEDQVTNGGKCWMRRGLWSQAVKECTVYLPIAAILQDLYPDLDGCSPASITHSSLKKWRTEFRSNLVTIQAYQSESTCDLKLELELSHCVISSECTWTLDLTSTTGPRIETSDENEGGSGYRTDPGLNSCVEGYLVLHLSKSPCPSSGSDGKWFPGQEWWDRVFKDDEPIETSCCSVGGDVSQLPVEARERAQRESTRFTDLSEEARREEMAVATQAKKNMQDSYARTLSAASCEDRAIAEVPERAAMLEAMRKEFPHIDITAK